MSGFRITAALLLMAVISVRAELSVTFKEPATIKINRERFDLKTDAGIATLGQRAGELLSAVPKEKDPISKRDRHALKALSELTNCYRKEESAEHRSRIRHDLIEVACAMANNHRTTKLPYADPITVPFRFLDALADSVCRGDKLAANVREPNGDPVDSKFWKRPANISAVELRVGFGRAEIPNFKSRRWDYFSAKRTGRNPGCELISNGERIKVKFAETHSEPFTARIFDALGYNVDPTDYVPSLQIKYDPRFFSEFNQRPPIPMRAGLFFIPLYTFNFQKEYDPFRYVEKAVLRNGNTISSAELKANFPALESQLDYLVTAPANVQIDQPHIHSVGAWGFEGLGREDLRELRGAGILAGWVGWWDSRLDNTRVRFVKTENGYDVRHIFTDLGGGLGASAGTFDHSCEKPEEFAPAFTRRFGNPARFEVLYQPIQDTLAFKRMTVDDARWMARLIAQLSRDQIAAALEGSGYDAEEVSIYVEKLWGRRNQLLRDLEISSGVPELAAGAGNPK